MSREVRRTLTAILAHADRLHHASAHPSDIALLDAIRRECRQTLDAMNGIIAPFPADPSCDSHAQPKPAKTHAAYVGWLRSRLAHIEKLAAEGRAADLIENARELKESASTMGFEELAQAAGVLQRATEGPNHSWDAALEILRRVVARMAHRIKPSAA